MEESRLNQVEQYASLLFSPDEICIILGIDFEPIELQFFAKKGDFYNAFMKGKLLVEAKNRKSIIDAALNGSATGQSTVLGLLKDLNAKTNG